jgi:hypothetical protein
MLHITSRLVVGAVMVVVLVPGDTPAQLSYLWTFDELTRRADCIVIAEARETRETDPGVDPADRPAYFPFVTLDTSFEVRAALKPCAGEADVGTIVHLTHFNPDWQKLRGLINGGSWLNFATGAAYLLYLKRVEQNLFEPLTGNVWPTESIYRLDKPTGEQVRPPIR